MSHFTTVVVCRDGQDPEELLAPFTEDTEDNEKYAEFQIEVKKEDFAKKAEEIVAGIKKDDEDLKEWKELLAKKKYSEIFEKWFGGEKHLGNWGYWSNPNAKWDWYQFGGRWAGYFKAKEGKEGERGTPSWAHGDDWKYPDGYYDALNFEDIDWEGTLKDEVNKTIERYRKLEKEFKEWYDEEEKKYDFSKKEEKDLFWERKKKKLQEIENLSGVDITKDIKEHVDRVYGAGHRPHAFITPDGEWYQEAEMGWWGMTSEEKPQEYREAWEKLLKESEPTDKFYLYDLHI